MKALKEQRERERERAIFSEIAFINSAKNRDRLTYNKERTKLVLLYDDLSFLQLRIKIFQKYYKNIKNRFY